MARIRTIKPEFWKDEDLCRLPEATHMLAAALLNYADDFGYFNANPELIKGECYPLREPSVSIPESLRSLQTVEYIRLGTGPNGRRYGQVCHFDIHQKVSHPTPSKISCLSITWDEFQNSPEKILNPPEVLRPEQGTGNREQGRDSLSAGADPQSPSKPKSERRTYPEAFEAFWRDYPTDALMSKKAAHAQWSKLSEPDREAARAAIPAFRSYCQSHTDYRPVHAERFLSQRRFDGFNAVETSTQSLPEPPAWGERGEKLSKLIGAANFAQWFSGAVLDEGPPAAIHVDRPYRRNWIAKEFLSALQSVFGENVHVECSAEKVVA